MRRAIGLGTALLLGAAGCTNYMAPLHTAPPRPNGSTPVTRELRELPAPKEKVVAAVYRFRDETGQYKPSANATSFSTAVTQGATSILIDALQTSGWFVPIEREDLSNLLNERQIIQQIRQQYEGAAKDQHQLPPLLFAGVMLEGGIIGYNTNTVTGGEAARYFGAGGSAVFHQDQVTVYLRAVSTQTGRVLENVHATKTILSQEVEAGIFRFVEANRLLQSDIGYSYNEPTTVAVREAIEESVRALVVEGIKDGLWSLADSADSRSPAILAYERDKNRAQRTDVFDLFRGASRTGFSLGLWAGGQKLEGNYQNSLIRPSGGLTIRHSVSPNVTFGLDASAWQIAARNGFQSTGASFGGSALYYFLPDGTATPYVQVGAGALKGDLISSAGSEGPLRWRPYISAALGVEYMVRPGAAFDLKLENQYAAEEGIDNVDEGGLNDSLWRLSAGFIFYLSHF